MPNENAVLLTDGHVESIKEFLMTANPIVYFNLSGLLLQKQAFILLFKTLRIKQISHLMIKSSSITDEFFEEGETVS